MHTALSGNWEERKKSLSCLKGCCRRHRVPPIKVARSSFGEINTSLCTTVSRYHTWAGCSKLQSRVLVLGPLYSALFTWAVNLDRRRSSEGSWSILPGNWVINLSRRRSSEGSWSTLPGNWELVDKFESQKILGRLLIDSTWARLARRDERRIVSKAHAPILVQPIQLPQWGKWWTWSWWSRCGWGKTESRNWSCSHGCPDGCKEPIDTKGGGPESRKENSQLLERLLIDPTWELGYKLESQKILGRLLIDSTWELGTGW